MADRTAINQDQLRTGAKDLSAAFSRFQDAVRTLQSSLAAEHGRWGDDKIGNSFAEKYVPKETEGQQGLTSVGTNGRDLADNVLPQIVDTLVGTDQENAALLAQDAKNLNDAAAEAEKG